MNKDLATAIVTAVIGITMAILITNLLVGDIQPFPVKTIDDASINADLSEPNPEIFNYRALNPTVEVYVGSCVEYNETGECVEVVTEENLEEDQDLENSEGPEENS